MEKKKLDIDLRGRRRGEVAKREDGGGRLKWTEVREKAVLEVPCPRRLISGSPRSS